MIVLLASCGWGLSRSCRGPDRPAPSHQRSVRQRDGDGQLLARADLVAVADGLLGLGGAQEPEVVAGGGLPADRLAGVGVAVDQDHVALAQRAQLAAEVTRVFLA